MSEVNYLICIPVYKVTDLVHRCLKSLRGENVLIIDNTGKAECQVFEGSGFEIQYQERNIGIPKAWNMGLKKNYDWTFICSSSMLFNEPFSHITDMLKDYDGLMFRTSHDWHLVGIHKDAVEQIGYFDENFYPGYFENTDWDYRCYLKGIWRYKMHIVNAICMQEHAAIANGLPINGFLLHDYLTSKWGEDNKDINWGVGHWGSYQHPFNDPSNGIDYWPVNSIDDLIKKYNL